MSVEVVSYDRVNHVLQMRWPSGNTYIYANVAPHLGDGILKSEDAAEFFRKNIAPGMTNIRNSDGAIGVCGCGILHWAKLESATIQPATNPPESKEAGEGGSNG